MIAIFNFVTAFLSALPELAAIVRVAQEQIKNENTNQTVKEKLKGIHEDFKEKNAKNLIDNFSSK